MDSDFQCRYKDAKRTRAVVGKSRCGCVHCTCKSNTIVIVSILSSPDVLNAEDEPRVAGEGRQWRPDQVVFCFGLRTSAHQYCGSLDRSAVGRKIVWHCRTVESVEVIALDCTRYRAATRLRNNGPAWCRDLLHSGPPRERHAHI